jgi:hypothetical protein
MRVGGQRHAPAALPVGKRRVSHCTGGWMGLRHTLDRYEKHRPHQGSYLGTSIHKRFAILTEVFRQPVCTVHGDTLNTFEIRKTEESFLKIQRGTFRIEA